MENEPSQPPTPPSDSADLQEQIESLRQLLTSVLLLLVVITGTIWVFLSRQVKYSGADLAALRAQTTNLVATLKPNEPAMDELVRKFQEFGRTNPDFVPYLAKYGIQVTNRPSTSAPAKKK